MAKANSKKKCYQELNDAYLRVHKIPAATACEVATWAVNNGLFPLPKRGDGADRFNAWREKLAEIESKAATVQF